MAVMRLLVEFMALVGMANALWLVQLNAEVVTLHAGARSPSSDAVAVLVWPERALGAFNDTVDKLSDITSTINLTVSNLVSTFTDSTDDFTAILGTLEEAASAAALLSPEINEKATTFIALANSTLQKATAKLPVVYATVQSELAENLATIKNMAFSLSNDFSSTAKEVLSLLNQTDSSALINRLDIARLGKAAAQTNEKLSSSHVGKRHVGKTATKTFQKLKKHTIKRARNTMVVKHNEGKKAVVLMKERALRGEEMALNQVDQSVARKGSSPCAKVLKDISAANFTLSGIEARIRAINGTASNLLGTYLDEVTSALSMINSSVAPAAASALPSNMLSPVTSGLNNLLSVGDKMMSTLQVSWEVINATAACEINNNSIPRNLTDSGYGYTLDSCKENCSGSCLAIDFYTGTGWCNFFDVPCDTPEKVRDGATSYRKTGLFATIQGMITEAVSILETVGSLTKTLVADVTQAQCDGVCGKKEKAACLAAE